MPQLRKCILHRRLWPLPTAPVYFPSTPLIASFKEAGNGRMKYRSLSLVKRALPSTDGDSYIKRALSLGRYCE